MNDYIYETILLANQCTCGGGGGPRSKAHGIHVNCSLINPQSNSRRTMIPICMAQVMLALIMMLILLIMM